MRVETYDEWIVSKGRYLSQKSMDQLKSGALSPTHRLSSRRSSEKMVAQREVLYRNSTTRRDVIVDRDSPIDRNQLRPTVNE